MWEWILPENDYLSLIFCLNNSKDNIGRSYLDNLFTANIHGATLLNIINVVPDVRENIQDDTREKISNLRLVKKRQEIFIFNITCSDSQTEDSILKNSITDNLIKEDNLLYPITISVSKEFSQDAVVLNQYGMTRLLSIFIQMATMANLAVKKNSFETYSN